jgi:hypothetical protein
MGAADPGGRPVYYAAIPTRSFAMVRTLLACSAIALAFTAHADVTIKTTSTGKGFGISGSTTGTTYIKGLKMRTDTTAGSKNLSTIFDVDAQKMYILDAEDKEAKVWDMAAFASELSATVSPEGTQASMTPNGQTRTISGQNTEGYDINIVVPTKVAGMDMIIRLTGTTWIAKQVPGGADYAGFYQGAADKGWIFSDPRAAQGAPGQARAMAQMYTEFARTGGVPYETVMDIKPEGGGAMGGIMAKVGGMQTTTTTDSVDTAPLADDLFQVPADYKIKQQ